MKTFEQWMQDVNAAIAAIIGGLTSDDLPDCCYRAWYENGVTAKTAAKAAIKNANE